MANKILSREDILGVKDSKQDDVEVSEWGGSVKVQSLTAAKRGEIMDTCMNDKGKMNTVKLYPLLLVGGCVDEKGNPVFTRTDVDVLNSKSAGAVEKVAKVIMKLSGIGPDDLEEAEKNS